MAKTNFLITIFLLLLSILASIVLTILFKTPIFFLVFFLPLVGLYKFIEKEEYPYNQYIIHEFKCKNCGAILDGWERYCPYCGYKVERKI